MGAQLHHLAPPPNSPPLQPLTRRLRPISRLVAERQPDEGHQPSGARRPFRRGSVSGTQAALCPQTPGVHFRWTILFSVGLGYTPTRRQVGDRWNIIWSGCGRRPGMARVGQGLNLARGCSSSSLVGRRLAEFPCGPVTGSGERCRLCGSPEIVEGSLCCVSVESSVFVVDR